MDEKLTRLVHLADRVVRDIEHVVPPQTETLKELRELLDQFKAGEQGAPARRG